MSYSSHDKVLADQIKARLEEFGITIFFIHDYISGVSKRANYTRAGIRESRLFLALVTKTYHEQEYTDQELGMAVYARKPVVCIAVDGARPRGFAQFYQHIHHSTDRDTERLGIDILAAVLQVVAPAKRLDFIIGRLANSNRFDNSNALAKHIDKDERLSGSQVEQLADAFVSNYQVHNARHFAGTHILSVLLRNFRDSDYGMVAKIKNLISDISWYKKQREVLQKWEEDLYQSAQDEWAGMMES